jgi:hypothetical protein
MCKAGFSVSGTKKIVRITNYSSIFAHTLLAVYLVQKWAISFTQELYITIYKEILVVQVTKRRNSVKNLDRYFALTERILKICQKNNIIIIIIIIIMIIIISDKIL